jgi:hypothetical protein
MLHYSPLLAFLLFLIACETTPPAPPPIAKISKNIAQVQVDQALDFYIAGIFLEDEAGNTLDSWNNPAPSPQPYQKASPLTEWQEITLYDTRVFSDSLALPAAQRPQRTAQLVIEGTQGEQWKQPLQWEQEQGVELRFRQAYSVDSFAIAVDLDFDKWQLDGETYLTDPHIVAGGGWLEIGAGLAAGPHKLIFYDRRGNPSKSFALSKRTKSGVIGLYIDLSSLNSRNWNSDPIFESLNLAEQQTLLNLKVLFLKLDLHLVAIADDYTNAVEDIRAVLADYERLLSIDRALRREGILFTSRISEALSKLQKDIDALEGLLALPPEGSAFPTQLQSLRQQLLMTTAAIPSVAYAAGTHEKKRVFWDYAKQYTKGHATTSMVIDLAQAIFARYNLATTSD